MDIKQWQELCEWADTPIKYGGLDDIPDGWVFGKYQGHAHFYPPQDMNTLFKWVVPKLNCPRILFDIFANGVHCHIEYGEFGAINEVRPKARGEHENDPFEALSGGIYRTLPLPQTIE